ncbi:hypothetical protein MC7420_6125 [Coleofasciculus chthonoplastes PCC 7420]|uniref:Uncharacterized protein n=1 Tax=Coleofasciculus chthonoplastes PCC 7420 TaxID=118168 RepID=B4VTM0_9CYAN|nr:hypothetical protein [Coleofasciculus chthonoplastes]EDX74647.1 hypothetical protein MC7420_6125 [Coleofasciculus chthonoplastes PCC 7420]
MVFTDFKSLAQVQQEYNIKYSEETFISYINLNLQMISVTNLNLT